MEFFFFLLVGIIVIGMICFGIVLLPLLIPVVLISLAFTHPSWGIPLLAVACGAVYLHWRRQG